MTKKLNILIAAATAFLVVCVLHAVPAAQAGASGSFSAAQVTRGEAVYATQCASCHGLELEGVADLFPALAGATFVQTWQDRSVGELFEKVIVTMPALDPGSMTPAQTADVVAYMLSVSKYPAGSADLGSDQAALNAIPVGAP
ncbi:MAG: cytochrome c [Acidobacteria bacterium]|nr:cytochrome c [Acidobacteriota bacterium]